MHNRTPANLIYLLLGFAVVIVLIIGAFLLLRPILEKDLVNKINRIGMVLELLGVLSVIPEVIGERKIKEAEEKFGSFSKQVRSFQTDIKRLVEEGISTVLDNSFLFPSGINGILILVGNIFGSILIIDSFSIQELEAIKNRDALAGIFFYSFYIMPFIWLLTGLVLFVYLKFSRKQQLSNFEKVLFSIFLVVHLPISFFSLPFTIALGILFQAGFKIPSLLLKLSFRQIITWVTLPLVVLGNLFQLISTFL